MGRYILRLVAAGKDKLIADKEGGAERYPTTMMSLFFS